MVLRTLFLGTISLFAILIANLIASLPPVGYNIVAVNLPSLTA